MRSLFVIPSISARLGGSVASASLLATALAANHDVTVWTTDHDKSRALRFSDPRITVRVFERMAGCEYFSPSLLREFVREHWKFDSVNVFAFWTFTTLVGVLGKYLGCQVFHHTQGCFLPVALRHHRLRKLAARVMGARRLMNFFSGAILCSESEIGPALRWGITIPMTVVPNPVSPLPVERSRYRAGHAIPADAPLVVYLNRFDAIKRVYEICQAFSAVQSRHQSVRFVLAGDWDNPYGRRVKQYAAEIGLRADFPGHLSPTEKWELLADANVLCQFSAQEGLSNAILEGLASGVPVVISSGCNFDEVSEQGAGIVVDSIGEFADAVLTLLRDPGRALSMGKSGQALVGGRFSISAVRKRLEAAMSFRRPIGDFT